MAITTATIEKTGKLATWGNSLGMRIPREAVAQLKLKSGESVKIQIKSDSITIRKAKTRKKWTEAELLKGVTPDMCGPELITGRVGRELI